MAEKIAQLPPGQEKEAMHVIANQFEYLIQPLFLKHPDMMDRFHEFQVSINGLLEKGTDSASSVGSFFQMQSEILHYMVAHFI